MIEKLVRPVTYMRRESDGAEEGGKRGNVNLAGAGMKVFGEFGRMVPKLTLAVYVQKTVLQAQLLWKTDCRASTIKNAFHAIVAPNCATKTVMTYGTRATRWIRCLMALDNR